MPNPSEPTKHELGSPEAEKLEGLAHGEGAGRSGGVRERVRRDGGPETRRVKSVGIDISLAGLVSLQKRAASQRLRLRLMRIASVAFGLSLVLLSTIGLYRVTNSIWMTLVWGAVCYILMGWHWDSLPHMKHAAERLEYLNKSHQLMKYLAERFEELQLRGPSAMLVISIGMALPESTGDDPYLEAAVSAGRIATIVRLLQECLDVADDLPSHYLTAIEGASLHEPEARVLHEFQKRREGRPSALEGWLPGPFDGSLDGFQNELLHGEILVSKFGLDERDVRMALGLYDNYRAALNQLATEAGT